jgi:2,3-bisphosphoglycerate-dependent phosphoglycerate mutase
MQTAAPIAAATALDVRPHAGLRERSFGVFEGMTVREVEQSLPDEYRRWQSRDAGYVIPGGGESLMQLRERARAALESIARETSGKVIVVTHGGFLDAAYRIARGLGPESKRDWPLLNASINTIDIHADGWTVRHWGHVDHLGDTRDDQV